jgi:hypothetical protein
MCADCLLHLVEGAQRLERTVVQQLLLRDSCTTGVCCSCCCCAACPCPVANVCLVLSLLQLRGVEALAWEYLLRVLGLQSQQ